MEKTSENIFNYFTDIINLEQANKRVRRECSDPASHCHEIIL